MWYYSYFNHSIYGTIAILIIVYMWYYSYFNYSIYGTVVILIIVLMV